MALHGPGYLRRLWLKRAAGRIKHTPLPTPIPRADGKANDQVALEAVIGILMEFDPLERKRIIAAVRGFFDTESRDLLGMGGRPPHPRKPISP